MQRLDMLSAEPQQHFIERSRLPERAAVKQEDLSSNPLLQAIQFETEGNFGLHLLDRPYGSTGVPNATALAAPKRKKRSRRPYADGPSMEERQGYSEDAEPSQSPPPEEPENGFPPPAMPKRICCNCRKIKCLKLYCDCFRAGLYCEGCSCSDCQNIPSNEARLQQVRDTICARNPHAFTDKIHAEKGGTAKHLTGCKCLKSGCTKRYCECFQAGVPCTDACRCSGCQNHKGDACNPAENGPAPKVQRLTSRSSDPTLHSASSGPAISGLSDEQTASIGQRAPIALERRPSVKPSKPVPPRTAPAGYHYVMQPVEEPHASTAQHASTGFIQPPLRGPSSSGRQDRPHPSRKVHPPLQDGLTPPGRPYIRPPQHSSGQPGLIRRELPVKRSLPSPDDEPWAAGLLPHKPALKHNRNSALEQPWMPAAQPEPDASHVQRSASPTDNSLANHAWRKPALTRGPPPTVDHPWLQDPRPEPSMLQRSDSPAGNPLSQHIWRKPALKQGRTSSADESWGRDAGPEPSIPQCPTSPGDDVALAFADGHPLASRHEPEPRSIDCTWMQEARPDSSAQQDPSSPPERLRQQTWSHQIKRKPLLKRSPETPEAEQRPDDATPDPPSRVSPGEALGMAGLHALAVAESAHNSPKSSPQPDPDADMDDVHPAMAEALNGPPATEGAASEHPVLEEQDFLCREDPPEDVISDDSLPGGLPERHAPSNFQAHMSQRDPRPKGQQPAHSAPADASQASQLSRDHPETGPRRPAAWQQQERQAQEAPLQPRPAAHPSRGARLHPEDRHRVARRVEDHEILAAQASIAARAAQRQGQTAAAAEGRHVITSGARSGPREPYRPVQKPYEAEVTPIQPHKPRLQPHQPEATSRGQRISPDRRSSSPDSSHGVLQPDSLPAGQVPMQLGFPASAPASVAYPAQAFAGQSQPMMMLPLLHPMSFGQQYASSGMSILPEGADTAQLTSLPAADTILYKVMYTKTPSGLLPVLVPAGTQ